MPMLEVGGIKCLSVQCNISSCKSRNVFKCILYWRGKWNMSGEGRCVASRALREWRLGALQHKAPCTRSPEQRWLLSSEQGHTCRKNLPKNERKKTHWTLWSLSASKHVIVGRLKCHDGSVKLELSWLRLCKLDIMWLGFHRMFLKGFIDIVQSFWIAWSLNACMHCLLSPLPKTKTK